MPNIYKSKSIYTLSRPAWLDNAGMTKGLNHDRQHMGIILAAGQKVRIRQTNANFSANLSMRLLNDDNQTEAQFSISSSWVEASVNAVSVPFIDTPYTSVKPVVEFEYADTAKRLPVYRKGENEVAFFSRWDTQDAEFGLIESDYAILLIPKNSKQTLKEIAEVQKIDGLIAYYDRIFTFYNALTGISFEPERLTDLNIKNRYFMKADKHGVGSAYYYDSWTAESTSSVSGFWLFPEDTNWGCLHEIAHGYQGQFMVDAYFSTDEMWNNIYAACYQNIMLGDRKYWEGWLYDYGNIQEVDKTILDFIANGIPLNKWDLRSKLYFAVLMIDKAGKNAFTHFNQQYRKNCNTAGFKPSEHTLLDMLSESFAVSGELVDVTPFIGLAGGYVTQTQRSRNVFSRAKAVYPLYQLVDASHLEAVKSQLKLDSSLRLVDSEQLKATGLTGSVSLRFNIDDFSQIYGEELILMEGARYACKTRITSLSMELGALPIGVYTLRLPGGNDKKYQSAMDYLVVTQGYNVVEISFVKKVSSPIISQQINLLGIHDAVFATLLVDHAQGKLVIDVINTTPHQYFPDVTYAKIMVRDQQGTLVFNKDIHGTDASLSHDELVFHVGDKIEIYHEEPGRLQVTPAASNVINTNNKTNKLTINKYGLDNSSLWTDPEKVLLIRLENTVVSLRGYPQGYNAQYSPFKDDIYLAINVFSSPVREQLSEKYKDCLPANNNPVGDKVGNLFTFDCRGIYDRQFLTATLDLEEKMLTVKIEAGIAHEYFDNVYVSFDYQDADGNSLYHEEVIGNQTQQMRSFELPISGVGGEVIRLHHEEPNDRLVITNEMQKVRLADRGKQQSYRVTAVGLERIAD